MNYQDLGFHRVRAIAPVVSLADPTTNAARMIEHVLNEADGASIVLFPELSLTGYSAEDLFFTDNLLSHCREQLEHIAQACAACHRVVVLGMPWQINDGRLLNCAAVIAGGNIVGLVPKTALPNYGEFYERRWFVSGLGVDVEEPMPISANLLFDLGGHRFGIEICEDLWTPNPPSADLSLAGAELILNLSASNEGVRKVDYRRDLVRMTSARQICAYVYASSGPTESSKDIVFGGHSLAAENGVLLGESERFKLDGSALTVDVDLDRIRHERRQNTTFGNAPRIGRYTTIDVNVKPAPLTELKRLIAAHPFVPDDGMDIDDRATEILSIQATGLARRLKSAHTENMVLALSGGLDSTQAFLVCLETAAKLKLNNTHIHTVTMPGPGTTELTYGSTKQLAAATGVSFVEISIENAVAQHLDDLDHDGSHDVVFENAQARERTQIIFNYANKIGGLVVGTGDLSELALGWCTYNADHMASYNVNASVPKTMMKYLVRWYARHRANKDLAAVLQRVLDTPISPELIPPDGERISQQTETLVGPYELHDFFLFHFLRNGFGPRKIFALAELAFAANPATNYDAATIKHWMQIFFTRFFSQQFKRTTLPPGPKVGSVSLSPRGDWRMPDEASVNGILQEIEKLSD